MRKKDKFLIVFLTIITLGFCWVYWKIKIKKMQKNKQNVEEIKLPSAVKINELIVLLGAKENIKNVESTISNLKVEIVDKEKINVDQIKQLKYVSGLMVSTNKITLIVGDIAKKLMNEMKKEIE